MCTGVHGITATKGTTMRQIARFAAATICAGLLLGSASSSRIEAAPRGNAEGWPLSLGDFLTGGQPRKAAQKPRQTAQPKAPVATRGMTEAAERAPAGPLASEAYATARHYMRIAVDSPVAIVHADEFSEIDRAADAVRIVNADELNEIDLAAPPAPQDATGELRTAQDESEDKDELFERILITFAGALAVASGMRLFMA